jgi:sugar phosphate isomerase/epimerase
VLAIENLTPGCFCGRQEEVLKLLEAVDSHSVGVCFDTGHARLAGNFESWAQRLLPKAVMMHIHDNNGLEDQHRFPGYGSIDWSLFARIRKAACPDAVVVAECLPPDGWDWAKASRELDRILQGVK